TGGRALWPALVIHDATGLLRSAAAGVFFLLLLFLLGIDGAFGNTREFFVGGFFLLEEFDGVIFTENFRPGAQAAVGGDFVMLDLLCGGDVGGVAFLLTDQLGCLLDEALHALALLALRRGVEDFEYLFQATNVVFSFFEVFLDGALEFLVFSGLGHFGQGLGQLLFRVVKVLQFGEKCLL